MAVTKFLPLVDMRNPDSLASRMRKRRLDFFVRLLAPIPRPVKILDIGGTGEFWREVGLEPDDDVQITVSNIFEQRTNNPRLTMVVGDARAMTFADKSFDIVYSNSVIEHLGELDQQQRMADEIQRVGKRYFVQTPNYFFPIEPHFLVPGFQWLPIDVRAGLLNKRRLGWVDREPDLSAARANVASVRLLRKSELQAMFPRSAIYEERFGPLCKSFIAYDGF